MTTEELIAEAAKLTGWTLNSTSSIRRVVTWEDGREHGECPITAVANARGLRMFNGQPFPSSEFRQAAHDLGLPGEEAMRLACGADCAGTCRCDPESEARHRQLLAALRVFEATKMLD